MKAHGQYTIRIDDHTVFIDHGSGFNEEGFKAFVEDLHQQTKDLEYWVIYAVVNGDLGLTPEALEAAEQFHATVSKWGCIAIAREIDRAIHGFLAEKVKRHSTIPWEVSSNPEELKSFLNRILARQNPNL